MVVVVVALVAVASGGGGGEGLFFLGTSARSRRGSVRVLGRTSYAQYDTVRHASDDEISIPLLHRRDGQADARTSKPSILQTLQTG